MIDKHITNFQGKIINCANAFVHRNSGIYSGRAGVLALSNLENRAVMVLAVGFTSLIDYIKFPLAAIEELVKGILLTPAIPFSKELGEKCFNHYKYAFHDASLIFFKLFSIVLDIKTLSIAGTSPHKIPHFVPPSYYGSRLLYQPQHGFHNSEKRERPSIHYP